MDRKLMLPTNWDPDLIPGIAKFAPAYVYGSLPSEATLRSSLILAEAGQDTVAMRSAEAAERGIATVYVMNATCLGNRELSEEGRGEILQRLQWLDDIGISAVVTANPFLMEMIRTYFPHFELHVSVLTSVDDPRKARYFEDLGASVIHLDPQINRNFRRLVAIRKAVRCRLSVVVNEGCVLSCPIRQYHANVISHSRESIAARYHVDHCYYKCSLAKSRDPVEYLRAPWIRPEDLGIYGDIGIDIFKVAGREKMGEGPSSHTDWIKMVARAYHTGRSDDVIQLLVGTQPVEPLFTEPVETARIRLDSSKLDGFLRYFQEDHCSLDCEGCDYCARWARQALQVEGESSRYIDQLESELSTIRTGSYRSTT